MKKYLIFNKSSTDSSDEGYVVVPLSSYRGSHPSADNRLELYFKPPLEGTATSGVDNFMLSLTITNNRHREVLEGLTKEFATGENPIIEFDNETSTFPTSFISSIDWTYSLGNAYDIGWNGSSTKIKILPTDFVADDGGRPPMIDDSSFASLQAFLHSHSSNSMYAYIAIPTGFKATAVMIYGSDTSQTFRVYEGDINTKIIAAVSGSEDIGTEKALTSAVTSDSTNYLLIYVSSDGADDEIHGGYVDISPVYA